MNAELDAVLVRNAARFDIAAGQLLPRLSSRSLAWNVIEEAVLASGPSPDDLENGLAHFVQGVASGRWGRDELSVVMENLPGLAARMGEALGSTFAELRAAASEKRLTADTVVSRFADFGLRHVRHLEFRRIVPRT